MTNANNNTSVLDGAVTLGMSEVSFHIAMPTVTAMRPLGENILIKRIVDPLAGAVGGGSKLILPEGMEDKSPWAVCVLAGPGAAVTSPRGEGLRDAVQRIGPGDLLLIKSFGGTEFKLGSHSLIFIKPEHVLAVFEKAPGSP